MLNNNILALLISLFLFCLHVKAQSGSTIAVGPPLTCDLTTFTCPSITNGCCTIGGCCGTGCCALGYKCINEGTSNQACCSVYDSTLCGTQSSPPPDPGSGGAASGDKTCTQIHNCRDSSTGQTWTCLLGQTCSLYYRGFIRVRTLEGVAAAVMTPRRVRTHPLILRRAVRVPRLPPAQRLGQVPVLMLPPRRRLQWEPILGVMVLEIPGCFLYSWWSDICMPLPKSSLEV